MKRFYKTVAVTESGTGFAVALDGRAIRTPRKLPFAVPHRPLAEAVAEEWRSQGETVDLAAMALTRFANTAIDRVSGQRAEVIRQVAAYAETDLVCYRAAEPVALAERQAVRWDPLLDWLAEAHGARLSVAAGITPLRQADAALLAVASAVAAFDSFPLTALHMATSAGGSVVIALALAAQRIGPQAAWEAALVDEHFQAERWGEDAEALRRRQGMRADMEAAARFFDLCRTEAPG